MGHIDGHPCLHGVHPYAMCEYCDELHIRATSYLVEQRYVLFSHSFDISDPKQLDEAAEWLVDVIAAIVPEACTGASIALQDRSTGDRTDKG
jgi:hypothetical protein